MSDLTAKLSFLSKHATFQNIEETENSHIANVHNINSGRLFTPKIEDPLYTVIEILDDPYVEYKKEVYPYVPPKLQTADKIETETALVDDNFIDLKTKDDELMT